MNTAIVIPTLNEATVISGLIEEILKYAPEAHIIVGDSASTDNTAGIVNAWVKKSNRVHLLHIDKSLYGRAHADRRGMFYALQNGAQYIFQMDADFSHHPKYIPVFLEAIQKYDIVIGSRLIPGGCIIRNNFTRNLITHLANAGIRIFLGLEIKDCTSGYRCYRSHALKMIDLSTTISSGPSLLEELLFRGKKKGFTMREIPIVFHDRKSGQSKLRINDMLQTLSSIIRFRFQ